MMEGELEPDEDPIAATKMLKAKIDSMYVHDLPDNSTMKALASIPYFSEPTTDNYKEQIDSCEDVKVLESYKLIVKSSPELQSHYDAKMQSLLNK